MTNERKKQKKARELICKALTELDGCDMGIPAFQTERISVEKYHEQLTREGITEGVKALVLINNMYAASVPGIDLSELLHQYLLDINVREKINAIIK